MEIFSSENIRITQEYGLGLYYANEIPEEELMHVMLDDLGQTIYIKDIPYRVIPMSEAARANQETEDGNYHFIYVQINVSTCEYYIGKVNRNRWSVVKKYQGSGLRFVKKYNKHQEEFVRYFILSCNSSKECEAAEAKIVNEELLEDPFCLNLVCGGGGTTHHSTKERNQKISNYMKAHPENYQKMIEKAKLLYQSEEKSAALIARNASIKKTMATDEYREMSSTRIKNWIENNPEAYARARKNNKEAMQSEECKAKRNASRKKWAEENPEKNKAYKDKLIKAQHSPEAEKKRIASLKEYNKQHPEVAKRRSEASAAKTRKPVNMLDLKTGEILRRFSSTQEAAQWLVDEGIAKNINSKTCINGVCMKRFTPGHGVRKSAYGYGWEHAQDK